MSLLSPVSELWFSDRPGLKGHSVLSFTGAHSCILTCTPCSQRENTTTNKQTRATQKQKNKKQPSSKFAEHRGASDSGLSNEEIGPVLLRVPVYPRSLPKLTLQADASGSSLSVKDNQVHEQCIKERPGTNQYCREHGDRLSLLYQ